MAIWIAVAIVALILVVVFCFRMFRIEKVEIPDETPSGTPEAEGEQGDFINPAALSGDGSGEDEFGDGFDFFGNPIGVDSGDEGSAPDGEEAAAGKDTAVQHEETDTTFDPLCQLKTGRGFLIDCQRQLDAAKQDGSAFAAVYFDFDRFRFINSLKGVSTGDYALSRMGQEMRGIFPDGALLTRLSADHFVAVLPLPDESLLDDYAEHLRRVSDRIRDDLGIKSGLRVCMGVAITLNRERDFDIGILIHRANIARHCMKSDKNNAYAVFEDAMVSSYLFGESAMEDYGENQFSEDFVLYFQAQASLTRNRIIGGEALARWSCMDDSARAGVLTSDNGRLPTQGSKIFYQTCRAISRWRKAGKDVPAIMSPLSIVDFYKQDIDEFVGRCLSDYQLDPASVIAEVSATMIRSDWSMASRQIKKLQDIGVQIAVDGVDTGYTSLDFLNGISVSYIKLHRGFIHRIRDSEERRQAAVRMMQKAADMGAQLIFDGVDALSQTEALSTIGASLMQGYYVGKPCSPEDFAQSLQEYSRSHRNSGATVILDDSALSRGDFKIY